MTSRNITVFIEGGTTHKVKLEEPFLTNVGTTVTLKQATVFWNFKNVTANNNKFTVGSTSKTLEEGYWDFQLLKERLEGEHIILTPNVHDNTCKIEVKSSAGGNVRSKRFGKLLGFPENHALTWKTEEKSPKPVDVNLGLKYLEITCDLIDSLKNVGRDGRSSTVLACLPITPSTRLNSSVSEYSGEYPSLHSVSDIVTEMSFGVKSNLDNVDVNVSVLLNLVVENVYK